MNDDDVARNVTTTINSVYLHEYDKEAGIAPLFVYQTDIKDIRSDVVIDEVIVKYHLEGEL